MRTYKIILFLALVIVLINNSFGSDDNRSPSSKFETKYLYVRALSSSQIPFPRVSDEDAIFILKTGHGYPLFSRSVPSNGEPFFQLFSKNCPSIENSNLTCFYLVVSEGFGNSIVSVFGPINLEEGNK